jgi:tRNA U34 5-methylaminomethyl-2-thiouridine-forming methyltransferase MnmC
MSSILVITEDGSHTVVSEMFGVNYHSQKGSIQESQTVFIDAGIGYFLESKTSLKILEMGFGSGLNAIMSAQIAHQKFTHIEYTGIEAFPISNEHSKSLNFPDVLNLENELRLVFDSLHEDGIARSNYFSGMVIHTKIENFHSEELFDIIYYDAFAPTSQEELWTVEMMQKMYDLLIEGGILVTYCAKGQFKRNLRSAGFLVEALPGPKGKREMTRAIKPSNNPS